VHFFLSFPAAQNSNPTLYLPSPLAGTSQGALPPFPFRPPPRVKMNNPHFFALDWRLPGKKNFLITPLSVPGVGRRTPPPPLFPVFLSHPLLVPSLRISRNCLILFFREGSSVAAPFSLDYSRVHPSPYPLLFWDPSPYPIPVRVGFPPYFGPSPKLGQSTVFSPWGGVFRYPQPLKFFRPWCNPLPPPL